MPIVLGSQSPRRKQILETIVPEFSIISPQTDEKQRDSETPYAYSLRITKEKMEYIIEEKMSWEPSTLLITSDTIVTMAGSILGKPENKDHAIEMLSFLSGKTHLVITGIALNYISGKKNNFIVDQETTKVTFKDLSKEHIIDYLNKITYLDKAGSYAFQEHGTTIIARIEGSRTNVIGFPLRLFFRMLCEMGIAGQILQLPGKAKWDYSSQGI